MGRNEWAERPRTRFFASRSEGASPAGLAQPLRLPPRQVSRTRRDHEELQTLKP